MPAYGRVGVFPGHVKAAHMSGVADLEVGTALCAPPMSRSQCMAGRSTDRRLVARSRNAVHVATSDVADRARLKLLVDTLCGLPQPVWATSLGLTL